MGSFLSEYTFDLKQQQQRQPSRFGVIMSVDLRESGGVRLAVEGCGHGTLHAIYASIEESCKQKGWPGVDLLIIGGDFQAVRNAYDLQCVSMPAKYREMCDFHEYYSGQRTAPCLTIFVGGNHEASNYLFELYYGGWVAPNIYYMGAANVLKLGPLRIAGLSGIWKGFDYRKPHFERLPYNESDMKSIYHVREIDARKLLHLRTQVDIGISHDWPQGIEWKGNFKQLFRFKPFFEEDARSGKLGSVAAKQVVERLRPHYWFSAHLHCKYAAVLKHGDAQDVNGDTQLSNGQDTKAAPIEPPVPVKNEDEIELDLSDADDEPPTAPTAVPAAPTNPDEIELDLDDDDAEPPATKKENIPPKPDNTTSNVLAEARAALPASFNRPKEREPEIHPSDIKNLETSFLALDKCLPNRHFLQLLSMPTDEELEPRRPLKLQYDREWLAITRAFALSEPIVVGDSDARPPYAKSQKEYYSMISEQRKWIDANLDESQLQVPENFTITAPIYDGGNWQDPQYLKLEGGLREYPNPQTASFCQVLQIPNVFEISDEEAVARMQAGPRPDDFGGGGRGGRGGGRGRGGLDRGRGGGERGRRRGGGRGRRGRGGRGGY